MAEMVNVAIDVTVALGVGVVGATVGTAHAASTTRINETLGTPNLENDPRITGIEKRGFAKIREIRGKNVLHFMVR